MKTFDSKVSALDYSPHSFSSFSSVILNALLP